MNPLILFLVCLVQVEPPPPIPDISFAPVLQGRSYREPVQVLSIPGTSDAIAVIERGGRVLRAPLALKSTDSIFLDLRGRLTTRNSEEGLLSVAFHPNWPETDELYVYRSRKSPRRTVLSRFSGLTENGILDPEKETVLLEIPQPYGNHNGGTVLFGHDGMLYLSVGDGGSANDPHNNGQNISTLLGTVLRIDISKSGVDMPYTIPPDNPFVDVVGARPEIWASGLRNIWRMSFDPKTHELWAGDVGQNKWEEINIIQRGGNYGWKLREGRHVFKQDPSDTTTVIEPIIEYGRSDGGSVTGGEVYRGSDHPNFNGVYVYGDYMSGKIWGARQTTNATIEVRDVTPEKRAFVSSFGQGPDGSILACVFSAPYQRTGRIMRIVPQ
ncbi:MAG: PQQ-dependent sugar dehydrogenase [Phycisphaerales bacterium]|nr:PQQ-dependent sugar dehydrogenase [Phycisphaerales bacterium]